MWIYQQAAGESAPGSGVCGEIKCREILYDQRPGEPESPGSYQRTARKDADHKLLQCKPGFVSGGQVTGVSEKLDELYKEKDSIELQIKQLEDENKRRQL